MYKLRSILLSVIVFAVCMSIDANVYAGTLNPSTGDTSGRFIWVFFVVGGIALAAIIIMAVKMHNK